MEGQVVTPIAVATTDKKSSGQDNDLCHIVWVWVWVGRVEVQFKFEFYKNVSH